MSILSIQKKYYKKKINEAVHMYMLSTALIFESSRTPQAGL